MRTNRTFAVFGTDAERAGGVSEENFHAHARAILEPLRERLIASGRTASAVDDHSHYGVAFTVNDPSSGGPVYVLLQTGWLLILERELTVVDRFRRRKADEVDQTLVDAVDAALGGLGTGPRYWCTRHEYALMERARGPAFRARGARKPASISLHVYSADPPLLRGLIQSACLDARLPGDLQWEVAFRRDDGARESDGNGAVATQRMLGWRTQSPDAARVRTAIEANDQTMIDELYARESVAAVDIRVTTKGDAEGSATIGRLIAETPARLRHEHLGDYVSRMDTWHRFRDQVGKVETWYSLLTPAARNDLSLTLQCDLWRVIGVLANGVMQEEGERLFSAHDKE